MWIAVMWQAVIIKGVIRGTEPNRGCSGGSARC
jgi:hypothetical protein